MKMMDIILERESHVHVNVLVDKNNSQNRPTVPPPNCDCNCEHEPRPAQRAIPILEPFEGLEDTWDSVKKKPVFIEKLPGSNMLALTHNCISFCIYIPNNERSSSPTREALKQSEEKANQMLSVAKEQATISLKLTNNLKEARKKNEKAQNEIETLKRVNECQICYDRDKNMVFLPCGHQACSICSDRITDHRCHICREWIQQKHKIFQ